MVDSENTARYILKERLRQAKKSFDLAYAATLLIAAGGVGASILFPEHSLAGLEAFLGGGSLSAAFFKFAKDANDRLDKLANTMKRSDSGEGHDEE